MFTKTEAKRRLDAITLRGLELNGMSWKNRAEVGLRTNPQHVETAKAAIRKVAVEGDDLQEFYRLWEAKNLDSIREEGAVVHIYLYDLGKDEELNSVVVGWMGTEDHDPELIDIDNKEIRKQLHQNIRNQPVKVKKEKELPPW